MNNTETKTEITFPNGTTKEVSKLISITREEFSEKVEDKLTIASYKELSKDRDSKGLINISKLDAVANRLRPSIIKLVSLKYRIKGTRSGHMNCATPEVLDFVEQINILIEQTPAWKSTNKEDQPIMVKLGLIVKEDK